MVTVKWCEYCGIKSCVRTVHVLHWRGLEKVVGDVAQAGGKVRVRSELILGQWISGWASNHYGNAWTRVQVLKSATCDKCQRKSNYSNVYAPTILPNSKSTVLPVSGYRFPATGVHPVVIPDERFCTVGWLNFVELDGWQNPTNSKQASVISNSLTFKMIPTKALRCKSPDMVFVLFGGASKFDTRENWTSTPGMALSSSVWWSGLWMGAYPLP